MRAYAPAFEMCTAHDFASALELLAKGYKPFAGGTDIMVLFNAGKLPVAPLVNIRKLREVGGMSMTSDCIEIGAAVTYSEIRQDEHIRNEFPLLAQSAGWTGSIANQNRGTLGGNIANASPAADSCPVLLVYDAELKLVSRDGERWVSYKDFHLGYKALAMNRSELISTIRLPRVVRKSHYGRKVGTRRAQAIAKISFAATADNNSFRIAAGSVAPVPLRCLKTEEFLASGKFSRTVIEEAKAIISREISPISDIRSTGNYRLMVTQNLLGEFLESLL